jgi:hypothetical protein
VAEHTPEHPRSTSAYAAAGRRDRFDAGTAADIGHGSGHDSGPGNDNGHEQGKGHQ